jgi:hypothetical protein
MGSVTILNIRDSNDLPIVKRGRGRNKIYDEPIHNILRLETRWHSFTDGCCLPLNRLSSNMLRPSPKGRKCEFDGDGSGRSAVWHRHRPQLATLLTYRGRYPNDGKGREPAFHLGYSKRLLLAGNSRPRLTDISVRGSCPCLSWCDVLCTTSGTYRWLGAHRKRQRFRKR